MNDYIFNVPGNSGYNNVFIQDPHIRLQKTGVNTHRNMIHTESQLLGIHIPLGRDNKITHNYKYFEKIQGINRPKQIEKTITKESRASHQHGYIELHHNFAHKFCLIHKKIQKCHLTHI